MATFATQGGALGAPLERCCAMHDGGRRPNRLHAENTTAANDPRREGRMGVLALVVGELQSPLSTIRTTAGRWVRDNQRGDLSNASRQFEVISGALERMGRLIEDLLELSSGDATTAPSGQSCSQELERSRKQAQRAGKLEGLHVLIVDDDVNAVSALSLLLEDEGMRTFAATSAVEGLECCAGQSLHIALIDAVMPGTSGLELLRRLRATRSELPVVLISGQVPSYPDIAEALGLPRVVYMAKPVELHELGRIIAEMTGRAAVK
jgi:CheY-like chemotaxis protein